MKTLTKRQKLRLISDIRYLSIQILTRGSVYFMTGFASATWLLFHVLTHG